MSRFPRDLAGKSGVRIILFRADLADDLDAGRETQLLPFVVELQLHKCPVDPEREDVDLEILAVKGIDQPSLADHAARRVGAGAKLTVALFIDLFLDLHAAEVVEPFLDGVRILDPPAVITAADTFPCPLRRKDVDLLDLGGGQP